MPSLVTTLGLLGPEDAGVILPHEHVFVDLRTPGTPGHAEADPEEVAREMRPCLEEARGAGVGVIVEASCVGVGRRVDILRAASQASGMPLLAPTGIYREPWVPPWAHAETEDGLHRWMVEELAGQVGTTGVRAGWIKLSAGDDGMTACERKIFMAAVRAARKTGAAVGSHTIRGRVVFEQLHLLESLGLDPGRFIWIHAQAEPDARMNVEAARRGAWVELDDIGTPETDARALDRVRRLLEADLGNRLLLSQDRGWFDPALPRGGVKKPYAYLSTEFLPKLRVAGIDEPTIDRTIRTNPFRAFARE